MWFHLILNKAVSATGRNSPQTDSRDAGRTVTAARPRIRGLDVGAEGVGGRRGGTGADPRLLTCTPVSGW